MGPIYHLCYGNLVFINKGYINGLYYFDVKDNYEIYKVNGQNLIAKLIFSKGNKSCTIEILEDYIDLNNIMDGIKLLYQNFIENH